MKDKALLQINSTSKGNLKVVYNDLNPMEMMALITFIKNDVLLDLNDYGYEDIFDLDNYFEDPK